MRRFLTVLLFAAIGPGAQAQRLDPDDYIYPIRDVARLYAANFGEIRPAHFHAGVDIKTDGAEGKPLVAVADGYVSRVSLTAGGYGRAVYLTLRNGTTAVYGHLQRFRDDIEEHVRQERTARRANSVNLWFGPEAWPVKQGDVIGFSGNSGSSMGPHLHFEIRENTDLLLSTLDNMLEAASLDSLTERLRVEPVDIDRLCRAELIAVRRLRQGQDIEYTIETPGEACIVPTHPKYFALVVRALLDNARKFTSKGRISLSYATDAAANELRVRITDTGCGVPPGRREELFGPLTDPSSESRGLSLALCRMIAEHLAGSIRLDAGYTKGARFIFTVPLKP